MIAPESGYEVRLVAPGVSGRVLLSNGLAMHAEPLPEPPPRHNTLVVAGGRGAREAIHDPAIVAWVAAAAARARRTTSVCTGAFLLAEVGLLANRGATTHWRYCDSLAGRHPEIRLDPDAVYVREGDVWTSAGVTAGIDLALALVEEDVGREVALAVARELVVFLRRPGGQSQFSRALAAQEATRPARRELQAWMSGHLDADLSVAALARRADVCTGYDAGAPEKARRPRSHVRDVVAAREGRASARASI